MNELLQGTRVLDFGRYIAGPYCAALLAEYGAEVIRIEKRSSARIVHRAGRATGEGRFPADEPQQALATLDPMTPEGRKS